MNTGFRVGPISWNGKDDFQDKIGRGTYIYKLSVKDENGDFVETETHPYLLASMPVYVIFVVSKTILSFV